MRQPTPYEIELWTKATKEIMERDGITEDEANANLASLLTSQEQEKEEAEFKEAVAEVVAKEGVDEAAATEKVNADAAGEQASEIDRFMAVVKELQASEGWTEEEAAKNFAQLLDDEDYKRAVAESVGK